MAPQFPAPDFGITRFSEGLARVTTPSGNLAYIAKTGKLVFKKEFQFAADFNQGIASVCEKLTSNCGLIDKNGAYIYRTK